VTLNHASSDRRSQASITLSWIKSFGEPHADIIVGLKKLVIEHVISEQLLAINPCDVEFG
jgi:hypothetical protein